MHLVTKLATPLIINKLKLEYTIDWVNYYSDKKKFSEPNSLWRDAEIIRMLRKYFEENCGYCGIDIGERVLMDGTVSYWGEVDHYVPKSKEPNLVYDWDNLIWACDKCNAKKIAYYDEQISIINPTKKQDIDILRINFDTGKYYLNEETVINKQRLKITEQKTTIHENNNPGKRKRIIDRLEDNIRTVNNFKNTIDKDVINYLEKSKVEIQKILHEPDFKKFKRVVYSFLLRKYNLEESI